MMEVKDHPRCGSARRWQVFLFGGAVALTGGSSPARAIDYEGRWTIGVRAGNYLHADKQGGGFRIGTLFSAGTERTVNIADRPVGSFVLGYGLKDWSGEERWKTTQLTIELEASRFEAPVGNETAYLDPNASSRVELCNTTGTFQDGDEDFRRLRLGTVTLTPVFVNALLHWGSPRADFYAGGGLGTVLADFEEDVEYREFTRDFDGDDDVQVKDVIAANLKLGSNVRLTRSGRWYLFVEGQFFATQLLSSQSQLTWSGVDNMFGQQSCDSNNDGTDDTILPADLRVIDAGKVRLDGAMVGLGLRYRFGGGQAKTDAAESAAP